MSSSQPPLPEFSSPPVSEVALSVQFNTLATLRSFEVAALWSKSFCSKFPKVEELPPLEPIVERFGVQSVPRMSLRFEAFEKPPMPRFWFLDSSGDELIQIQSDRFVRNWRRVSDQDYPRFTHLRNEFSKDFGVFKSFVDDHKLGELVPNQCEVTYVNTIAAEGSSHGEIERLIRPWSGEYSDTFLPHPEDVNVSMRYIIFSGEHAAGRLHVRAAPGFRSSDGAPVFLLTLIARGEPLGAGIDGVLQFFNLAHEWIVRGFASITTKQMHTIWGRNA